MGPLHFGTDGVRGRALTVLTTDYVTVLGRAAAHVLGDGHWWIARDTRESSPQLAAALAAGLGAGAVDLGVLPTPALAHWSQRTGIPAAMVTASHNPWHDNGVKIFAAGGTKLADDTEAAIEAALEAAALDDGALDDAAPAPIDPAGPGEGQAAAEDYVAHVVTGLQPLDGLRVVLDCANGAMSAVAPRAFAEVGAEVITIHHEPDGRNINDHCGATHTESLRHAVVGHGAALGLAFDGDGDRVIAVDHVGNVVDGDRLIALSAMQLRDEGRLHDQTVVVTVMSNLGFHKAMQAAGIRVVTTSVGDRYVLEALDRGGYSLGGEQSGHIIYRDRATTGDGLLAGLQLAERVRHGGRSLAEMAGAVMTRYPQVLLNVRVAGRHPQVATEMATEVAAAEAALAGEGRVLLRPSGTEPLIRVMVEAATADIADAVAATLVDQVHRRYGG
jgi:phosphoglucosamine mutase